MMFLTSAAATEAAFDFKSIKELMDGFDPAALLPEIDSIVGKVQVLCSLAILAAPVIMLCMGIAYLFGYDMYSFESNWALFVYYLVLNFFTGVTVSCALSLWSKRNKRRS